MKTRQTIFWVALLFLALIPEISFSAPPSADLSASASLDYEGPSLLGQERTYSITISNAGPDTATGVVISNQLPSNVQLSSLTAGEAFIEPDGRVAIKFDTLPPGQSLTFDLVVSPTAQFLSSGNNVNPDDLLSAPLSNTFVVSANETDPSPANNSVTATFDVDYSFPGTPNSPYDLGPLHLSDSNQVDVLFFPTTQDQPDALGEYSFYYFPNYGSPSVSFTHLTFDEAYPGDVVILGGTNTSASADTNIANWLAVVRFFNPADPTGIDLVANEKQAFFPASVIGPDGFTNFTLLPNAIFVTGSATSSNGFVTASAAYNAEAFGFFGGIYFYNIPITANHSPTGVSLTAISTPEPVVVGNDLAYLLTISNSMPRIATDVTISNFLSGSYTFVSVAGGIVTTNKGALLINTGSLAPGATNLVTLVVKPTVVENFTNLFHVFADQPDPDPNAGFATVVSTVNDVTTSLSADVSVTTTNFYFGIYKDQYTIYVRSNLTCWLTVSNAGPATATGLTLNDFIPPDVNFVSATGGTVTSTNGVITVDLASLPAGATNQVQIVVEPTFNFMSPVLGTFAFLTNNFEVSANEPDPVAGNNITNVTVGVGDAYPGIPVAGPGTNGITAGSFVTMVVTSHSGIPSTYFDTLFLNDSIAIPGDLVILTGTNDGYTNIVNWAAVIRFFNPADPDGTLGWPATESEAFFPASVTGGIGFTNFALFPDTKYALQSGNNGSNLVTTYVDQGGPAGIFAAGQFAVVIYSAAFVLTADVSLSASGPDASVPVGSNMVYSLIVSNAGPQAATDIIISNQLPANVSFVSASGVVTLTNGAAVVNVGSLAVGGTENIQVVLQSTIPGEITNVFQVLAFEAEPNSTNNSATVVSRADNAATTADLALSAEASAASTPVGSNFIYSLTVSNAGPLAATGIVISNQLSANVHFLWATGVTGVNATGGSLLLNLGSLGSGAHEQVQIFAQPTAPGEITNQFQVSATEADFNVSNNISTIVTAATSVFSGGGSPTLTISSPKFGAQLSNQVTLEITGGTPGLNYTIEYSSNLFTWLPATPIFVAGTNGVQWIDAGPPQTDSAPGKRGIRYYRAALQSQ